MSVWVGTSGWSYDHWNGVLYADGLPPWRRLETYTGEFQTVELNASFYRWPNNAAFVSWRRRLPDGFRMSVKAPRGLTHGKLLYAPEIWVQRMTSAWHELGDKRAVLLVQLPPGMQRDDERLRYFLAQLPPWLRVAVELRHESWNHDDVFRLLEQHGAAYCVMSGANLPCVIRATSDIVYIRLHGPDHSYLYGGSYSDTDLAWWADRIAEWNSSGHEVYAYFNNDGGGNAVRNARTLKWMLGERL
ncbi:MAG: sensor histidine kinase [Subtercola sp.]|nr:sensor histidine kinase [Subtercola sp.]